MKTIIEQVVEVISQNNPNRLIRKPKTEEEKQIEKDRKEIKQRYPNSPLRYRDGKWRVVKEIREECDLIDDEIRTLLSEMALIRTGSITVFVMKVRQYAQKVTSNVQKLRSLASRLESSPPESVQKVQAEITRLQAENDENKRKMIMYSALISAAGGLGADRAYDLLQKLTKSKKR